MKIPGGSRKLPKSYLAPPYPSPPARVHGRLLPLRDISPALPLMAFPWTNLRNAGPWASPRPPCHRQQSGRWPQRPPSPSLSLDGRCRLGTRAGTRDGLTVAPAFSGAFFRLRSGRHRCEGSSPRPRLSPAPPQATGSLGPRPCPAPELSQVHSGKLFPAQRSAGRRFSGSVFGGTLLAVPPCLVGARGARA